MRSTPNRDRVADARQSETHAPFRHRVRCWRAVLGVVEFDAVRGSGLGRSGTGAALIDMGQLDVFPGGSLHVRGERADLGALTRRASTWPGEISALGVEEQRVYIIADFTDASERRPTLGDNFRVEARIVISEHENVLRAPASALFQRGGT